ncbi:MAG TPA: pilus (MSHA type) biogenesis protein MshL [Noviherbaspirillum sp.]|uniref:pilus (MSHA type) biogenesis protein MshL n=1 Tax=Noviherbaspirillum sp. TaxID=1926288 RepID=UPI002F92E380
MNFLRLRGSMNRLAMACGSVALAACATPMAPSTAHLKPAPQPAGNIPQAVQQSPSLAPPKPRAQAETYSVTVHKVPVQSLLFALARDARLNVDIHPGIEGQVTLNALNQTLPQLLTRISRQVDMRYELEGSNLVVLPDMPYLRNYRVDYVNIARNSTSNMSIATQVASGTGPTGGGGDNNSTTSVTNTSNNRFWETLVQNIKDTLHETDKVIPEDGQQPEPVPQAQSPSPLAALAGPASTAKVVGSGQKPAAAQPAAAPASAPASAPAPARRSTYREAASVIANPETGVLAVRATSRQHEKVQEFLDMVMMSAKRQVLIEATVVEVELSRNYQQGILWSRLAREVGHGIQFAQAPVTGTLPSNVIPGTTPGLFLMNYTNPATSVGSITATIQLLESFGKVKVLSSPKISALNNQTAMLKVVDNRVYFTITADTQVTENFVRTTYTSTLHTVPVGFVMSVTPQIADSDEVTLNVRPTISRIVGYEQDPNPALAQANPPVISRVPVIQTREMESVLKVGTGQIAVMGGLMQDSVNNTRDGLPGIGDIPLIGDVLNYRNETNSKTELVIFMRPVVVRNASLQGDFRGFRDYLEDVQRPEPPRFPPLSAEPQAAEGAPR